MKKKKLVSVLALGLMIPAALLAGCSDAPSNIDKWDGSVGEVSAAKNGVIEIDSAEELAGVAAAVNNGETYEGITLKLTKNINLNGKAWTPIGNSNRKTADANKFSGIFDGAGKKIIGLTNEGYTPTDTRVENADFDTYGYGLFGYTENATIKNITVEVDYDCDATSLKGDSVGGIVGYSNKGLTMQNCTVNGTINGGFDAIGGVVGRIYNSTETEYVIIENCTNNAEVSAQLKAAGIAGYVGNNLAVKIDNCKNTGDIKAVGYVEATNKSAQTAGITNYTWNPSAEHTLIITNNINSGDLYNMNELGLDKTNVNSFATIANQAGQWFVNALNPHYDFTGNTNTGKVYVAGQETEAFIISGNGQDAPYDANEEFNGRTNIVTND